MRYNYDDRKALPASAPSSIGYAALDRHFPVNQSIPEYIFVQSPHDLRTPQALADLEQMADRVSQLPNVAAISGITRPTGNVPEQFRATYQAGAIGSFLAGGSTLINDHTNDLNRLSARVRHAGRQPRRGARPGRRAGCQRAGAGEHLQVDEEPVQRRHVGPRGRHRSPTRRPRQLAQQCDGLELISAAKNMFAWIGPVLTALQGNPVCDADESCSATRGAFERLVGARDQEDLDAINDLAHQLQDYPDKQALKASTDRLRAAVAKLTGVLQSMGMDQPGGLQANLTTLQEWRKPIRRWKPASG